MKDKVDIGCGRNKDPEFTGSDIHDWPSVDIVLDLEKSRWPIEDSLFNYIKAIHVVEHINDQVGFFREIHYIARHHAVAHLEMPRYSSRDSWADLTHVRHMSLLFADQMTANGYLSSVPMSHMISGLRYRTSN